MQVPAISSLIQEFLPLGPGIAGTIASLLVFAGAFVAVAFAMQDVLKNFMAGLDSPITAQE